MKTNIQDTEQSAHLHDCKNRTQETLHVDTQACAESDFIIYILHI